MTIKRLLTLLLVAALSAVMLPKPAYAADFNYRLSSTYKIDKNEKTTITTIIEVENQTATETPESIELPVSGKDVKNITAEYQDDAETTAEYNSEKGSIIIDTSVDRSGEGVKWSLVVDYEADISITLGRSKFYQVGSQDYKGMNIVSEKVVMSAHLDLGLGDPRGPDPESTTTSDGNQIFTWNNPDGQLGSSVGLLYGELGLANVELNTTIKNDGWWWKTITVTLPPDTNQQQVFLDEITPKPTSISLDTDGNVLAKYNLRPKQSVDVSAKARIVVNNFSYSLDSSGQLSEIPEDIVSKYTALTEKWQSGDFEFEINENQPAVDLIRSVYDGVSSTVENEVENVEQAQAVADTLVGALRSNGVPARVVLGHVFGNGAEFFDQAKPHAWVEAFTPGVGWISLDASFESKGDYFGATDVQRVGLVLRGIEDDFPPEQLGAVSISYVDEEVPDLPDMTPTLSATNHMILPGIALTQVNVTMPSGVIVDGAAFQQESLNAQLLGSLAPLQTSTTRSLALLDEAFATSSYDYGITDGAGGLTETFAQTTSKVSYVPLIVISVISLLIIVVVVVKKKRSSSSEGGENILEDVDEGEDGKESMDELIMSFSDEPEKEPVQKPEPTEVKKAENPVKSDTIKKTNTAATPAPTQNLTPQPVKKKRKPPRLIQ